jgi:diacylglycerol kinase (ATP)
MKTLVIVNPIAGRGNAGRSIPRIEKNLHELGLVFDLVRTERPWHAAELAEQAAEAGYELLATASGDGTANEALNGLMRAQARGHDRTALSILPLGTGNDFAYGMGMRGDLETTCRALVEGRRFRMDVGLVTGGDFPEGRYFGNGVGVGFDAAVGFEAAKIRWLRGFPAYLIAALRTIFIYFRAPVVEITHGEQAYTQASLLVSVMNGQRLGGGFFTAPDGIPDDGLLDLCIASAPGKLRTLQLLLHVMKGTQATQPEFRTGRTPSIRVRALEGTLPAHCDGETLCYAGEELRIELIPGAITFLTQA